GGVKIKSAGMLLAKKSYMDGNKITALKLSDANGKNVHKVESTSLYNDSAKADGSGFYYFATNINGISRKNWDKNFYAISYITYDDGGELKTVYGAGYTVAVNVLAEGL
ncbi:MAG: hypothetical protein FWF08_08035, partial [Oscillospiraceae bacterium]|nr:hypothetical protein [Oscillospiraceae bacterium]